MVPIKNIEHEALNIKNVKVLPSVPKNQVLEYLDRTDAGIIHLKNDLYKTVVPSKMFEYIAMGVPIIHGVDGESHNILKKYKLGLLNKKTHTLYFQL